MSGPKHNHQKLYMVDGRYHLQQESIDDLQQAVISYAEASCAQRPRDQVESCVPACSQPASEEPQTFHLRLRMQFQRYTGSCRKAVSWWRLCVPTGMTLPTRGCGQATTAAMRSCSRPLTTLAKEHLKVYAGGLSDGPSSVDTMLQEILLLMPHGPLLILATSIALIVEALVMHTVEGCGSVAMLIVCLEVVGEWLRQAPTAMLF